MLELRGLQFGFPHRTLFRDLSFTVEPSDAVLVTGPNGAGKSTLLSVIIGLLRPSAGQILWHGAEPDHTFRRDIEYLQAEHNNLFVKLDAYANLSFWQSLRPQLGERVSTGDALDTWGLQNAKVLRLPVERFSTGMRRRLALARMMVSGAKLWIMDEPIYGLDAEAILKFRQVLAAHLAKGGAAIIVSHDRPAIDGLITQEIALGG